ncbi:MFS transporter [Haloglycomyces albus]|uniref:MFS transporter n=1 Tax=Haloglycomyces albus TaxID=526067 RepID=UPI0006844268|nr:MFS transporter [Haloglycomyces albus]
MSTRESTSETVSDASDIEADKGHPYRWWILAVLVLSLIIVVLDNTVLNVAMKTLADPNDGIGASQSELAWMINSYTLVFAGLLFAFGIIGDKFGRKRLLLIGLLVFGIASLLSAYALNPTQLIWYRALQGVGAAAMMPSTLSLLRSVFSNKEFPKALGIWTAAVGAGGALGPMLAGVLLERFWWGSIFLINVPIVIVAMALIVIMAPESKGPKLRTDVVGMILTIVGLVALTYGIIEAGDSGQWGTLSVWGPLLIGIVVLTGFVLWEKRIPYASLDMNLFKNARFAASSGIIALIFFASMAVIFFMTFYIQIVKGFSPFQAGMLFLPFAASMMIFSPLSNNMVERFGPKAVGLAGSGLVMTSLGIATQLETDTPTWVMVLLFAIQGTGMSNLMPPAMNTLMSSVPKEKAGVASSLANTLRQVGGSLGVAVLGTVMAQNYRSQVTVDAPQLPAEAQDSIASTYGAVEEGAVPPEQTGSVMSAANESFVQAMHLTAWCAVGVGVLAAIVVALFFPTKGQVMKQASDAEQKA